MVDPSGEITYTSPVNASVTVSNHAGMVVYESEVRFSGHILCSRCCEPFNKDFAYRFNHILVASLPEGQDDDSIILKHRTICSILMLCSEMIFFWSFRQSSSVRIHVKACVQSAVKILIRASAPARCVSPTQDLQPCRRCLRIDFLYFKGGYQKWQYLRERLQKQEEIRDVHQFGSSVLLRSLPVLTAANTSSLTEHVQPAVCTRAEWWSTPRLNRLIGIEKEQSFSIFVSGLWRLIICHIITLICFIIN